MAETLDRRYAIGTRAIVHRGPRDYRVVCATCDAGSMTEDRAAIGGRADAIDASEARRS